MPLDIKPWLKRLSLSEWLPLVAGIVTTALFLVTFVSRSPQTDVSAFLERYNVEQLKILEERISGLNKELDSMRNQLKALASIPDENKIAIQLKGMDAALSDLKTRHTKLEDAIMTNPTKAIEVPLLRKDLDNLKDSQSQNLLALQQGVDRVYDLNKWLLGAMAVSIITLAISNFVRGRKTTASGD